VAASSVTAPAVAGGHGHNHGQPDLGRQVLGDDDGWAAAEGGTTGGSAADDDHEFVVDTWDEFRAALGGDDARGDTTDRIVYVDGEIHANVFEDIEASCDHYADQADFDFDEYLARAATWTEEEEDADQEMHAAREAAAGGQNDQVRQFVGSNVTIVGLGSGARIVGAHIFVRDADNVIIRNLTVSDAYQCFPEWDPTDGDPGTWNADYDNISVRTSSHVWLDHNTFDDGEHPPSSYPELLGAPFEVHDGLVDVTHGSNYVTISYNEFLDHDKTMLIGSSNSGATARGDFGKLNVTVHHNLFDNLGQRLPRVRFGQVHVYNNHYVVPDNDGWHYAFGVGVAAVDADEDGDIDEQPAGIYAEDNYFTLGHGVEVASLIADWGGPAIHLDDSYVQIGWRPREVNILGEYNATADEPLSGDVGWEPEFVDRVHPGWAVPFVVRAHAGAGELGGWWR
jgi:pectate lyase